MLVLTLIGTMLIGLALLVRELRLVDERRQQAAALLAVEAALEKTRAKLRRTLEDVYVLQTLLLERNVLDEQELAKARARLVEAPRRAAEERAEVLRTVNVSEPALVVDEGIDKLH